MMKNFNGMNTRRLCHLLGFIRANTLQGSLQPPKHTTLTLICCTATRSIHLPSGIARRFEAYQRPNTRVEGQGTSDSSHKGDKLSQKLRRRLGESTHNGSSIIVVSDDDHPPSPETNIIQPDKLALQETRLATAASSRAKVSPSRIKSAAYIQSSLKPQDWPVPTAPEIAVIGRSNVGKSSLINMLTERKELALVSKTPGKTRTINHFLIDNTWYLVDLPGYGYAKTSKDKRFVWGKYTQQYFLSRSSLIQVLLLVDATVPVQSIDVDCARWLFEHDVPFSLVYTKLDKRKKKCEPPANNIAHFEEALRLFMPYLPSGVTTSATAKRGKTELLGYLAELRSHVEGTTS